MKTEWKQVAEKIREDDFGKADITVPTTNLNMTTHGRFGNTFDGFLMPDEHALGQIASRLGIPTKYARKMMEHSPELLAENVNHWLWKMNVEAEREKKWLLRTKGEGLRAVLTDKYTELDNHFVFNLLSNALENGEVVDIKNFDLNSKYLNFRAVFPDLKADIGSVFQKDEVMVGIHVTNSEVGASSLRIHACLWRQICSNGMIAPVGGSESGGLLIQRHAGLTTREMQGRVIDAINESMLAGDGLIEQFARTKDIKIEKPMDVLKKLAQDKKYTNKFTDDLISSYHTEPDASAFGIVNAMTRASQTLPFEQRLEVETDAGKVMNNFLKRNQSIL